MTASMLGPTLSTARLTLRPPLQQDFEAWADSLADEETQRFLGGTQPRGQAWRTMAVMAGSWALQGFGMFSVIERDTGRWVGRIGPWRPEGWPGTEVGWGLVRDCWGKGYAVEAAAAAIDFAFDTLGWTEVIHCIHPDNIASQRVAERLGSVNRGPGTLPAPLQNEPIEIWGQDAAKWLGRARGV